MDVVVSKKKVSIPYNSDQAVKHISNAYGNKRSHRVIEMGR
jgi:hypothetical protein